MTTKKNSYMIRLTRPEDHELVSKFAAALTKQAKEATPLMRDDVSYGDAVMVAVREYIASHQLSLE